MKYDTCQSLRPPITATKKSYLSPKTQVLDCAFGRGIFAKERISRGETIINYAGGPGVYLSTREAYQYEAVGNHYTLQVDENLHLVSVHMIEDADYVNHSCEPTCGIMGREKIVAMRSIEPGEEITFDYAMSEAYSGFRLRCLCGKDSCRKTVTGHDWKNPRLQRKYRGWFSVYIGKKIMLRKLKNKKRVAAMFSRRMIERQLPMV